MTFGKFETYAKTLVGKSIKMAGHPSTLDTILHKVHFNQNELKMNGDSLKGSCTSTNDTATSIFCFEYYDFPYTTADTADMHISEMERTSTRWGGTLASVELNPNKSLIWIARLHISDAWIHGFVPTDKLSPATDRRK